MKNQTARIKILSYALIFTLLTAFMIVISCSGGGGGDNNPVTPPHNATYVGTAKCAQCHQAAFDKFTRSGHASILKKVENGQKPEYPYSQVMNPPGGFSWADIAYVIGGYAWKAEFVGKDGRLIAGGSGQYNLEDGTFSISEYAASQSYDCAQCHTTAYSSKGNQGGLAGIAGTWTFNGVQCEQCHGPGSLHAATPKKTNINLDMDPRTSCAACHMRGSKDVIEASGGFLKNHQQFAELENSPHRAVFKCSTCHDPHASSVHEDPVYNPMKGLSKTCQECHPVAAARVKSKTMEAAGVTCLDCHMPSMVKSAKGNLSLFKADLSTHLFKINVDPNAPQFSADGKTSNPYITIPYACQQCHIAGGSAKPYTIEALAEYATDYHSKIEPGTFVQSTTCKACHSDMFDIFMKSGHPNMMKKIEKGEAPQYPYSAVPNPPSGYDWSKVAYVVGGYRWKAVFIGLDGNIITGSGAQFNVQGNSWMEYHVGQMKGYDCGSCHTTGYSPTGKQDNLPGITGTWLEAGVHCEACHGAGGTHVLNPSPSTINIDMPPEDRCATCHSMGTPNVLEADSGFIMYAQQAEEIKNSPHTSLNCTTCHDPHRSSKYADPVFNPDKGMLKSCEECHADKATNQKSGSMVAAGVSCQDCHMAPMVKAVTGDPTKFKADMKTHLFKINTDVSAQQFSSDGKQVNPYITVAYACQRCHISGGSAKEIAPETLALFAQGYHNPIDPDSFIGTDTCKSCHPSIYEPYSRTGHAFIMNKITSGKKPNYPYSDVPNPPAGYLWQDIAYVIGGYKWRANFIGHDGYIITGNPGDQTQYNVQTGQWNPYNAGSQVPYDCARCHSTGYSTSGKQGNLPGIFGTWEHNGVQCEACHGAGGAHISAPGKSTINVDMKPEDRCASCHTRGHIDYIEASGGFGKNHAQVEELKQSPHSNLKCTTCHDPHRSSQYADPVYNPNKGLNKTCVECHAEEAANQRSVEMKNDLSCTDCHMAPMDRSAAGNLATFTADVKSHLFEINTDPKAEQFTPDGTRVNGYLTVKYACQRCHISGGGAKPLELESLAFYADGYHDPVVPTQYMTSQMCKVCHSDIYNKTAKTGHAYVMNRITGGQAPQYPYSSVPNPPAGYTWSDIAYVIGGWKWKAVFIGTDGNLITGDPGDTTQYNLASKTWIEFHAGQLKGYDCGSCHTTGYSPSGHQGGLPGITGSWSENGVRCEACHGAGGLHITDPKESNINVSIDPEESCQKCHSRGSVNVIEASGGFALNYQQYDEYLKSPHAGFMKCSSCHDPHTSVLYSDPVTNPNKGLVKTCMECHPNEAAKQKSDVMKIKNVTCISCHMPKLGLSAEGKASSFTGDIHSHIMKVNLDIDAKQFTPDGTQMNPYLTVETVCLQCHGPDGPAFEIALPGAVNYSTGYHE